jgi:hypothetical protein
MFDFGARRAPRNVPTGLDANAPQRPTAHRHHRQPPTFHNDQSINLNLATPQFPIIKINSISLNQSRYVYIVDATFY